MVTKFFQKIVSVLMLVILSSTIIPYNLFHHHHSRYQVADSKSCGQEACYNSIYKPFDRSVDHCNHKNHVSEELDDCIFCSLKFVHLTYHFLPEQNIVHIDYQFSNSYSEADLFPELQFYHKTGNRGPPSQIIS